VGDVSSLAPRQAVVNADLTPARIFGMTHFSVTILRLEIGKARLRGD